ncbi:RNA-recognition motif [Sesbania bispinosa]|nr:RNA-recognition motif [Sesbania bispinosa]
MSTTVQRTPRSGRQSLFFQDLASPVSSRRGKFSSPGQAAAVSALWRENLSIPDYQISPETKSDTRTPTQISSREFSTPVKSKSEASTSYALRGVQQNQQGSPGLSWWSPATAKSGGEQDEKGRSSPVEGVVQPGALITLPPPLEVARPEVQRNSLPAGNLDEEEWAYRSEGHRAPDHHMDIMVAKGSIQLFTMGISTWQRGVRKLCLICKISDTNLVLREFEKCGEILKHVPGPREANWMHILYQNRSDAQKALNKNGMQINGVLIVGVKPLDPMQRQALNERHNNQGFMPLPLPSARNSEASTSKALSRPYYLQNGNSTARQTGGTIASPTKSLVSKIMDLMFGV